MSATASSGVSGHGMANKNNLNVKAEGLVILLAGRLTTSEVNSSPPSSVGQVIFPKPLKGLADNYVVVLTSVSGGFAEISSFTEENGNFTGFHCLTHVDSDVCYIVTRSGSQY